MYYAKKTTTQLKKWNTIVSSIFMLGENLPTEYLGLRFFWIYSNTDATF
jgi:hypothetical protein